MKINLTKIKKSLLIIAVTWILTSCTTGSGEQLGQDDGGDTEETLSGSIWYEAQSQWDNWVSSVTDGFIN